MQQSFRMNRAFEDFPVGSRFVSTSRTISAKEMIEFARQYDPQPFHVDEEAAKKSVLGGLCASGWHTASAWMKCNLQTPLGLSITASTGAVKVAWVNS